MRVTFIRHVAFYSRESGLIHCQGSTTLMSYPNIQSSELFPFTALLHTCEILLLVNMPFGINNPFPTSMKKECEKAGKVGVIRHSQFQLFTDISPRFSPLS